MKFTAAIVGLGNIGMGYDKALPAETYVLSHARAFHLHPDFKLVGGVDPDPTRREEFSRTFDTPVFCEVKQLLSDATPDMVAVASPTSSHGDVVAAILARHTPQAILCEKPLADDSATAQRLLDACGAQKVSLYANYIRRADPGVLEVKSRLEAGVIAMPFKAVVWYSKGLRHNGSHFADLLTFWFGPIRAMHILAPGRACGERDAEPDVRFDFDRGSAIFCAAREEDYSHHTVEIVAANGRLRYEQGGTIIWQAAAPHPALPGYRQLQPTGEAIASDMNRYQYRVAEQLSLALRGNGHALCDGTQALANQRWLDQAINERISNEKRHE